MLTALVMMNAVCLMATLAIVLRIWRPAAPPHDPRDFATVLAAIRPAAPSASPCDASHGTPIASSASPSSPARPDEESTEEGDAARSLPLRQRLTILRYMLQGKSVDETAALAQTAVPAVRALFLQHARRVVEPCS
jgi:DNA-directed RNA polymerase specialized sigma24 family protein